MFNISMMASNVISMCISRSLRAFSKNNLLNQYNINNGRRFLFRMNTSNTTESNSPPIKEPTQAKEEKPNKEEPSQQPEEQLSEKEKSLLEENKKLTDLISEIDDKYKRALADGENTRVRMNKQIEEARLFGIQKFCKDLLEVADVLHTAIESVAKDSINDNNEILKNLFQGVQMTEQQLQSVFKRHGLTQVNPIGEKFNPNEHHALCQVDDPSREGNTVAFVSKIGYKLQDRIIRPAMVGVVKS